MGDSVLYVCATPIGHLGDCSYRLIETLQLVDRIAAEDTRHTRRLLLRYGVSKPMISLEKFNELNRIDLILSGLASGESVALVSDAGTPTVSDPGAVLVQAVREAGYFVVPVPGPSAIVTLLSVAGLRGDSFTFSGFLPRKHSEFNDWYARYRQLEVPIVFYESPKRIIKHLEWVKLLDSEAYVVLGKEMTKQYERFYAGQLEDVLESLNSESPLKGEWCGAIVPSRVVYDYSRDIDCDIQKCREIGLSDRQIRTVLSTFRDYPGNMVKKTLWS